MSLYLQRHENREDGINTFTKLTNKGIKNSKTKILKNLENAEIDIIYSSPFLRTLQTVSPYASKNKKIIRIENGFMDILREDDFSKDDDLNTNTQIRKQYNIYKIKQTESILSIDFMKKRINENKNDFNKRLKLVLPLFMQKIKKYIDDGKNVVIVSHRGVIQEILNFLNISTLTKIIRMGDLIKVNKNKIDNYYLSMNN
jgi:broad specificity phosphatase PhoE